MQKIVKIITNPYTQPEARMKEMHRLLADGSPAALAGLVKRFGANASGQIADEDEKKWLEEALVELGEDAMAALESFIRTNQQLTYALRAYQHVAGPERARAFFSFTLEKYGPENHRAAEAKLQLVWQLADAVDVATAARLVPFVLDHSDDVRWAIMDIMEKHAGALREDVRAQYAECLSEIVTDNHASPRIIKRAAEVLMSLEIPLPESTPPLATMLESELFVDKKRILRRRAKTAKE